MRNRLPYRIEPAPPDLSEKLTVQQRIALIVLIGALSLVVVWTFATDGPPPSERPSDTFYGLSEGE